MSSKYLGLLSQNLPTSIQGTSLTSQDIALIHSWLKGRPAHTFRAYASEVQRLFDYLPAHLSLNEIKLSHLQDYMELLRSKSKRTQARAQSSLQSLFSFAHRAGYLPTNPALFLQKIPIPDHLTSRILTEEEVIKMITFEPDLRNKLILKLLYSGGLRVSELCQLKWKDCVNQGDSATLTLFGKGGKTRTIRLKQSTFQDLLLLRKTDSFHFEDPIFQSREEHKALNPSWVARIVKRAGHRAGLTQSVSPHWLRHAHASHSLDRGAPIHLVKETLGHSSIATTGKYLHAKPEDSSSLYLGI